MKKFATSLMLCLALAQSSFAATSALTESLLEYEAITNAIGTDPNFDNIIPPNEFIIDIKRLTRAVNSLGEVRYKIVTSIIEDANSPQMRRDCRKKKNHCHDSHHNGNRTHTYIATLTVTQNPGVGPNIIVVDSIVLVP